MTPKQLENMRKCHEVRRLAGEKNQASVLKAIRDGFTSAPVIALEIGLSRPPVIQHIKKLEARGDIKITSQGISKPTICEFVQDSLGIIDKHQEVKLTYGNDYLNKMFGVPA